MSENEIKPGLFVSAVGNITKRRPPRNCKPTAYYPQSAIDRLTAERDVLRFEKERLQEIRQQLEAERDEAQRKLSVAVAEGKGLVADAERYFLVQASDAECLVRDAERYLDGGRSAGCRLAAKRVRVLLAARAEGGV